VIHGEKKIMRVEASLLPPALPLASLPFFWHGYHSAGSQCLSMIGRHCAFHFTRKHVRDRGWYTHCTAAVCWRGTMLEVVKSHSVNSTAVLIDFS
jgi:hypothetical protein